MPRFDRQTPTSLHGIMSLMRLRNLSDQASNPGYHIHEHRIRRTNGQRGFGIVVQIKPQKQRDVQGMLEVNGLSMMKEKKDAMSMHDVKPMLTRKGRTHSCIVSYTLDCAERIEHFMSLCLYGENA